MFPLIDCGLRNTVMSPLENGHEDLALQCYLSDQGLCPFKPWDFFAFETQVFSVLLAFLSLVNDWTDRFGRRGDQRVKKLERNEIYPVLRQIVGLSTKFCAWRSAER